MKEYWMRWYVTVNAEANTQASWLGGQTEFPAPLAPGVIGVNSYKNAEVWLEVDMSPTWYISGGGRAYFALAEVELADYALADSHKNLAGATVTRRPDCSVSPLSPSSLLAIYDAPFGGQSTTSNTPYEYLGRQLNPQYFKDKAYLKLDLNDFGVWSEMVLGIPPVTNHGDVAVWALDVKVFVIGEWLVQDVQENPDIYGRFEQVYGGYDWFDWIIPNLPWLVPLAIFLILVFFAPMVLISIINALR